MLEDTPLAMPSTRKQKAKEKRSRQSDVMSDLKNMSVMLGKYPKNRSDEELNENIEIQGLMGLGPTLPEIAEIS